MRRFPNPRPKTREEIYLETQYYQNYLHNHRLHKRVRHEIRVHLKRLKQRERLLR